MNRLLLLFVLACAVSPVSAQTEEIEAKESRIRFDRNHSTVGFSVPIMGGLSRVTGKFRDFDVKLVWNEDDLTKSSVNLTIPVSSVDTGIDDRDEDIQGENIFDAKNYPVITFVSTDIRKNGSDYIAHGTFTLHGVSKEIYLSVRKEELRDPSDPENPWRAWHVQYRLDRREYGISWQHNSLPMFFGYDIDIDIQLLER